MSQTAIWAARYVVARTCSRQYSKRSRDTWRYKGSATLPARATLKRPAVRSILVNPHQNVFSKACPRNGFGCYNTPVADNPIGSVLKPLLQAAASSVVGPYGLVVAPAIAIASAWAGERLGGESEAAKAIADVLSHVFGHLSGDAAKEVFSSLREHGNHDLEIAMATAIKEALQAARKQIAPTHRILVPFEDWFQLWDDRLSGALESPEDAALLFYSSDAPDPVALAAAEEDQWWPSFRPLLLRWA